MCLCRHFPSIVSFSPLSNSRRKIRIVSPFYRGGRHRAAKHFVPAGKWKGQDSAWTCRFYPSLMLGGCSPPSGAMRQTKEKVMKQRIKCRGPGIIPRQGMLALAFCLTLVPTGERGDCPGPGHCHTAIASMQTSWSCTAGHLP